MKRLFDFSVSLAALIVLAPLIAVLAIVVRIFLGKPILFSQIRPGIAGRRFKLLKFRSMIDATDREGYCLPDAERLTQFGRTLRSSSLDELPTLWNVVKGDMSIVGPRPLLEEYLPLYSSEQARRHEVRPGITGWAQVNGRNAISWDEKFELDVWYVDNQSLRLDIRIIALTFVRVFRAGDVSHPGQATMSKFTGSD